MPSFRLVGRAPLLTMRARWISGADVFDLRELEWATPFDVVVVAALYRSQAEKGRPLKVLLPEEDMVRRYLVDVGIDAHLSADWGPGGGSLVEPPLVRLTRLGSGNDWEDELKTLWPAVRVALGEYEAARRTLDIMSELIDNATSHGESPIGTFVLAQRYTGVVSGLEPGIWIGVADGGIGIPRHLRRREEYAGIRQDEELIRLAWRPGVTGIADRRGYGFYEVFEDAAAAGRSQLLIQSGKGQGDFALRTGNRVHARYRELSKGIPGTWIHVRMQPP
jgi:hypothetical protein